MHPRGHISHVHSTASKYPFCSCRNNAVGTQNVHQTTESFTWTSLSSSAAKAKENFLALCTWIRWMEKGLLPIMKLRSPYKEKSRTSLTKEVHGSGTSFCTLMELVICQIWRSTLTFELTKMLFQTVRGGVGPFFMDLSTTLFLENVEESMSIEQFSNGNICTNISGFFATEHSSQSTVKKPNQTTFS